MHEQSPIQIGERHCLRDEAIDVLKQHLDSVPDRVSQRHRVPLGSFRGLSFGITLSSVTMPPKSTSPERPRARTCSPANIMERGLILNALDRLVGDYDAECACVARDLAIAQTQLRDYQAQLGIAVRSRILFVAAQWHFATSSKLLYRAQSPRLSQRRLCQRPEAVEQMKVLRAAHTIEAATRRMEPH